MASFLRFAMLRGFNVDLIAEWEYSDRPAPAPSRGRPAAPASASAAEASGEPDAASVPHLTLTYSDGHKSEVDGEAAAALHQYFRSIGSALT